MLQLFMVVDERSLRIRLCIELLHDSGARVGVREEEEKRKEKKSPSIEVRNYDSKDDADNACKECHQCNVNQTILSC